MKNEVIVIEGISKSFGAVKAVDNLSLRIYEGELYGFLGLNGAGKSTTIKMLASLLHPDSGSIYVMGQKVTPFSNASLREVGFLLSPCGFLPYLTAFQNMKWISQGDPRVNDERISSVLDRVGLLAAAHRKTGGFSLGMLQRLGLASALLHRPKVLVLDEPTNGLDPMGMIEMRHFLRDLVNEGITIFLSSHLLNEVEQICDRIGIISRGKLIVEKTIEEVKQTKQQLEDVFLTYVNA
ncbi:MAG: ABC transporter ATP-binding protein [Chloroflexota bacterium]